MPIEPKTWEDDEIVELIASEIRQYRLNCLNRGILQNNNGLAELILAVLNWARVRLNIHLKKGKSMFVSLGGKRQNRTREINEILTMHKYSILYWKRMPAYWKQVTRP